MNPLVPLLLLLLPLFIHCQGQEEQAREFPLQTGPFAQILGQELYALEMVSETEAQLVSLPIDLVLENAKVVGLFTPELMSFYDKVNKKSKGAKKEFEIIFVSRCRDFESFGQYFSSMPWFALPVEAASGELGEYLSAKYKVKSIPTLVLLDGATGATITTDGRNKIPSDKAGVGFPWRSPMDNLARTLIPGPIRGIVGSGLKAIKRKFFNLLRSILFMKPLP